MKFVPGRDYDPMAGNLSKRQTFFFCCLLSTIGILLYGHEALSVRYVDNISSIFDNYNLTSSELNASGSWPNYRHIWKDYYGTIPAFYNCQEFAKGNVKNISHYAFRGRIPLTKEPVLSMECDHIRRRVMGNTVYERVKHPYAIARNVYENYYVQELLLAFSYSPSNMYCYAIDKKSQKAFKKHLKQLGNCLPNVIVLEKEYSFDSAGHRQDQAHYDCSADLLQYPGWEYLMFSQNADIFLKTPEEISEIISVLNGTAFTSMSNPIKSRIPKSKWTAKELKLFRNESQFSKDQLNKAMVIRKSPNHMFLPRAFVQAVNEKLNLTKMIDLFESKKYGVDEMLYITLLHADFLNLPGQMENSCIGRNIFRYVHWNFGNEKKCQSFKKRHSICLIGMEYIPIITKEPHIIANKIWPEWDFGAIMCMGEILYNRTNVDKKHKLNLKPYYNIPQVREQSLKIQGTFNSSSFIC